MRPLGRKTGSERSAVRADHLGRGLDLLELRLARIRGNDPRKFVLFTGRDQMQAQGLFARQLDTPNHAAHGGFCFIECGDPHHDFNRIRPAGTTTSSPSLA